MRGTVLRPLRIALFLSLVAVAGCGTSLPDPGSQGAQVLAQRCGACHRVYQPSLLTAEMWRYQVGRMRQVFAQRGVPWLTPADEQALLEYLAKHAGG